MLPYALFPGIEIFDRKTENIETTNSTSAGWLDSLVKDVLDVNDKIEKEDATTSTPGPCVVEVWRCLSGVAEEGVRYLGHKEDVFRFVMMLIYHQVSIIAMKDIQEGPFQDKFPLW